MGVSARLSRARAPSKFRSDPPFDDDLCREQFGKEPQLHQCADSVAIPSFDSAPAKIRAVHQSGASLRMNGPAGECETSCLLRDAVDHGLSPLITSKPASSPFFRSRGCFLGQSRD